MTVKEYLSQAFMLNRLINAKKARIQDLRDMQQWVGGTLSDMKVKTSKKTDKMAELTVNLLDLISDCTVDIRRLLAIQQEIEDLISAIAPSDCSLILYERYINLKHWEDIAYDNNYGWDAVHRRHREGLLLISRVDSWLNKWPKAV